MKINDRIKRKNSDEHLMNRAVLGSMGRLADWVGVGGMVGD